MASSRGPTWQPKVADYRQVFAEQNPWHELGNVPSALAWPTERPMARCLGRHLQTAAPRRYQLVLGPRRVGKTTVMYQVVRSLLAAGVPARRLWWLRLDHPLLMRHPLDALVRLVAESAGATADAPVYLFLDELTYAAEWDLWLKTFYDEGRPFRIAGTSSSTAALRGRRQESGIGRWEEQYLQPYLFTEFLDLAKRPVAVPTGAHLAETIDACLAAHLETALLGALRRRFLLTGGFPEVLLPLAAEDTDDTTALLRSQRILRSDAVERAIYKDIPQAYGVDNPMLLERLLYTLAGQVTGLLSPTTLGRSLDGLSQPTFDRYLSYLERAFLVFTLPNYAGGEAQRQRRGRKLYFVDGAVRNAALQRGIAPLNDSAELGLLTENMVAGHLHALSQQSQTRLYHWRDRHDELDLVYDHPESPLAFEIGLSARHSLAGVRRFVERYPRFRGRCYLAAPGAPALRASEANGGIGMLPLDLLLVAIGAQAERELERRLA